jgi:toxin ParE1/3/4
VASPALKGKNLAPGIREEAVAEQAWRFVQRIRARCERIGDVPHGGRPRDDLAPGLRTVPFERSAVIAYMFEDHQVRVTNVLYGGRAYEALYGSGDSEE